MFGGPEHRSSPTPSVTLDLLTTGSNTFSGAMLTSTESEHVGTNGGQGEQGGNEGGNEGGEMIRCTSAVS